MRYAELVRKLRHLGCEFRRQAKGSHEIWWQPSTKKYTTIPRHEGRDIPKATLAAVLKDLGLTERDLESL